MTHNYDRASLGKLTVTILSGLLKHGREKTLTEILDEAGVNIAHNESTELAAKLETFGLIDCVSCLKDGIRASLTAFGEQVASFVPSFGTSVLRGLNHEGS